MTELPQYVVVGRGRWASRMNAILGADPRFAGSLEQTRRQPTEDTSSYRQRLASAFKSSGAQIAWLCVPPGEHIPAMIEAAIDAGLHVIVEKPWFCSREETHRLQALSKSQNRVVAIHFEYCLLEEVQRWRSEWHSSVGLSFSGRLTVNRPNHMGIPALDNLGSHLFSMHEYCVPNAAILEIDCGYERPNERRVWLNQSNSGIRIAEIDLLANKEPIIQRFFARVEAAIRGDEFPFDLSFALRVAERAALWRKQAERQTQP
jgi:hypothetical protein